MKLKVTPKISSFLKSIPELSANVKQDLVNSNDAEISWSSLKTLYSIHRERCVIPLVDMLKESKIIYKTKFIIPERSKQLELILSNIRKTKDALEYRAMVNDCMRINDKLKLGLLNVEDVKTLSSYLATTFNVILTVVCTFFMILYFTNSILTSMETRILAALFVSIIVAASECILIILLLDKEAKTFPSTTKSTGHVTEKLKLE